MGQRFYEATMPKLAEQLERINVESPGKVEWAFPGLSPSSAC
jgi:hypothetical protein